MEKSVIWDLLPIILVVSVVFGSLFFVDFTGMVVTCTDVDGDGYNSCSGCEDVLDLSGMSGNFKKDSAVAFEKIVYTVQSPNAKNVVTYSVPKK